MDDLEQDQGRIPRSEYFADQKASQTANILIQKAFSFFNVLEANAYLQKIEQMWRAYHGAYGDYLGYGHQISFTGEQGELVHLPVNHFRNIASHMYNMVTSSRPIMEARAINTDYKSLAQTYLANGILDYYWREKNLEMALKKAVEMAIVMGAGYVKLEWNATAGDTYDVDDESGEFVYEGEMECSNLSPFDVVFDGSKESWNNDWYLTRTFKNRYDLMAKYPEMAHQIEAIPSKVDGANHRLAVFSNDQTDDVPVFEFYHRRTESMPNGRYMFFLSEDVVIHDIDLPYRVVPIFRLSAGEILGTPYSMSPLWDVYPIQEMINATYSAIATNQNAFAVQNIFVERGSDISINTMDGALNILEGNKKPEPLQLCATPPEAFKFLELLIESAETISGINSVARGNPEASLKSGSALALVQSMALQFISGLQQSYVKMIEDVGTALLQILKDYANTPKLVALVGKNNKTLLKEFTGDQIKDINRVVVDVGNPLSRTIAGRVQMAEQLLQMKLLRNPQQYFQVISTGRLDVMFEGDQHEMLLIKQENERMLQGGTVQATLLDSHRMHIMEHKSVLADPELRLDPTLVGNALSHIQEHIDLLRTTDPGILETIGEQPLPPMPPMGPDGQPLAPPQPMPGGPQQPPQKSLKNSPNGDVMQAPPTGMMQPGEETTGGQLPGIPKPPAPFENAPTDPAAMGPA